jgi:hypothetical protein
MSRTWQQQLPIEVVNAVLSAYAHVGDGRGALKFFQQQVLGKGLTPDSFSFSALLTAVARNNGTPLAVVERVRRGMEEWEIPLGVVTGTALINAYRRVRTWGNRNVGWEYTKRGDKGVQPPSLRLPAAGAAGGGVGGFTGSSDSQLGEESAKATASLAAEGGGSVRAEEEMEQQQQQQQQLEEEDKEGVGVGMPSWVVTHLQEGLPEGEALARAVAVLQELQRGGLANVLSYTVVMAFCLELGDLGGFKDVERQARQAGIVLGEEAYDVLVRAADEGGLMELAGELWHKWQQLKARQEKLDQRVQQGSGAALFKHREGGSHRSQGGVGAVKFAGGEGIGADLGVEGVRGGEGRGEQVSQWKEEGSRGGGGSSGGLLAAAAAAAQQQKSLVVQQLHDGGVQGGGERLARRPAPPVLKAR